MTIEDSTVYIIDIFMMVFIAKPRVTSAAVARPAMTVGKARKAAWELLDDG